MKRAVTDEKCDGPLPTQVMKNDLFSNRSPWKRALPFVIPRACELIPFSG